MAHRIQIMRLGSQVIVTFDTGSVSAARAFHEKMDKQIKEGRIDLRFGRPVEVAHEKRLVQDQGHQKN